MLATMMPGQLIAVLKAASQEELAEIRDLLDMPTVCQESQPIMIGPGQDDYGFGRQTTPYLAEAVCKAQSAGPDPYAGMCAPGTHRWTSRETNTSDCHEWDTWCDECGCQSDPREDEAMCEAIIPGVRLSIITSSAYDAYRANLGAAGGCFEDLPEAEQTAWQAAISQARESFSRTAAQGPLPGSRWADWVPPEIDQSETEGPK